MPNVEATRTAYHITDGPTQMYIVDAQNAVGQHPTEWRFEPWTASETNEYRQRKYDEQVRIAQAAGQAPPPPPPEFELTEDQQAEVDNDERLRQEAREIVAKDDKIKNDQREWDQKVARARAYLAQPAPQFEAVPVVPVKVDPGADIPANWRDMNIAKKRGLAVRLGAERTIKNADVDAYIAGVETRRKGDAKAQADAEQAAADKTKG